MIAIILSWVIFMLLMMLIIMAQVSFDRRRDRDAAYEYILSQWRKGLLAQPPDKLLAEKIYNYETAQSQPTK